MHVACSSLCFSQTTLDDALKRMAELEFSKFDLAIRESSQHLRPSEVAQDVPAAVRRLRNSTGLTPAAITLEIETDKPEEYDRQFSAVCKFARLARVPLITINAAPVSTDLDEEVKRLRHLIRFADREGVMLSLATLTGTLTETPDGAVKLCKQVPGLGLTLDPSHYVTADPNQTYDQVYPYVKHVLLRDSAPNRLQVHVGQGQIEYSRVIAQLSRFHYNRLLTVDIRDTQEPEKSQEPEVRKLKFLLESLV